MVSAAVKTKFLGVVAVALAISGAFSQASATDVTLTYTGVVGSASDSSSAELDNAAIFGRVGESLAGDAYTAVYVYDTSRGTNVNPPTSNYFDIYGGSLYGTQTPAISESMTINGVTVSLTDTYWGEIILCSVCVGANSGLQEVAAANSEMTNILYATGSPVQFPPSLNGSLNFNVVSNTTDGQGSRGQFEPDNLYLIPSTVTISTDVPEPSTWAMLLLGFAGLGFMAYRRKSTPVLSAA